MNFSPQDVHSIDEGVLKYKGKPLKNMAVKKKNGDLAVFSPSKTCKEKDKAQKGNWGKMNYSIHPAGWQFCNIKE